MEPEYDKHQETLSMISNQVFNEGNYFEMTELSLKPPDYIIELAKSGQEDSGDPDTKLDLNSKFFRSPEFEQVQLLVAGCSQTFGAGVDNELIWPYLLSKKLNYSYANIAVPGLSVQGIVGSVVSYIQQYGKPKVLAINLPGYGRMALALKPLYNTISDAGRFSKEERKFSPDQVGIAHVNFGYREIEGKDIPLISKRPHVIDEIMPYEVPLHQSMFALSMLIEYCKAADIKLIFTTWHGAMNELIERKISDPRTRIDLSGYCKVPTNLRDSECHLELKSKHEEIWDEGRDHGHHMGVHAHIHVAEAFANKLKEE